MALQELLKKLQGSKGRKKQYLKITNKGTVNRKYFELIGATDKRERFNDPSIIGNKGSGAKLAVIPALRLGLEVVISSSDEKGEYVLSYKTQDVDLGNKKVKQIVFDYGDYSFPSQLTLDGFQDWDKPITGDDKKIFKALREYVVNAYDEDKDFKMEITSEIGPAQKGKTTVYLTLTKEIEAIFQNSEKYFKILNAVEPVFSSYSGNIYPKSDHGSTRLFSQGVLVNCESYNESLYDYSLNDKYLLSEERIIKDHSLFTEAIGELISRVNQVEIIFPLLEALTKEEAGVEAMALSRVKYFSTEIKECFKLAWEKLYGPKAVIASDKPQIDLDAQHKGYQAINVSWTVRAILKRLDIPLASDVVPVVKKEEKPPYEEVDLTPDQKQRFDEAYRIFKKYFSQVENYPVFFFKPTDFQFEGYRGFSGIGERQHKEIWINRTSLSSVRDILVVLEHEFRHCETKAGDYERYFTQRAGEHVVDLMLANPNPSKSFNVEEFESDVIKRGIVVPSKLKDKKAHILITGSELRIKSIEAEPITLSAKLEKPVKGMVSQVRRVSRFRKKNFVFIPQKIKVQLPCKIELCYTF